MIVPSSDNLYSDESEDGAVEIDIYVRKYQLLLERSEVLQQVSECCISIVGLLIQTDKQLVTNCNFKVKV